MRNLHVEIAGRAPVQVVDNCLVEPGLFKCATRQ